MKFILQRLWSNDKLTYGFVYGNGYIGHSLEDEPRQLKLRGETRIPSGIYELKIRKEDTPLTIKHRANYGAWFKYHIEITGVNNFLGVYVHAGNDETHTDGCLLLGDCLDLSLGKNQLTKSTQSVKKFYDIAYPELEKGNKVLLEIKDNL